MRRIVVIGALALISVLALSSCTGMMMSTDFGYDDFYPGYNDYNWYWNSYPYYSNGFFGPPGPPPRPRPPHDSGVTGRPVTGGNPGQTHRPATAPSVSGRPGNMGQPTGDRGR